MDADIAGREKIILEDYYSLPPLHLVLRFSENLAPSVFSDATVTVLN